MSEFSTLYLTSPSQEHYKMDFIFLCQMRSLRHGFWDPRLGSESAKSSVSGPHLSDTLLFLLCNRKEASTGAKVLQFVEASWGAHLRSCLMKRQLKIKGVFPPQLKQSRNASYQFNKLHPMSTMFKYATLWITIYRVIMREQPSERSRPSTPQYGSRWVTTEAAPV